MAVLAGSTEGKALLAKQKARDVARAEYEKAMQKWRSITAENARVARAGAENAAVARDAMYAAKAKARALGLSIR